MCFRAAFTIADGNVIDVGEASVIGATDSVREQRSMDTPKTN